MFLYSNHFEYNLIEWGTLFNLNFVIIELRSVIQLFIGFFLFFQFNRWFLFFALLFLFFFLSLFLILLLFIFIFYSVSWFRFRFGFLFVFLRFLLFFTTFLLSLFRGLPRDANLTFSFFLTRSRTWLLFLRRNVVFL